MCAELTYEFTKDPSLLYQYYNIREDCYKEEWGLKIFSGTEDEHDRNGHILIVRNDARVIGGGRLVMRSINSSERLPLETDFFLLHEIIPKLKIDENTIGEIGRIAVVPEFRGEKVGKISLYLLAKAQFHHCNYLSTVAPFEQAKKYRQIAERLNIDITIFDNIAVADHPYYNNIEMKLLLCDLTPVPDASTFL